MIMGIKYRVARNGTIIADFFDKEDANKFIFSDAIYDNYEFWKQISDNKAETFVFYNEKNYTRGYSLYEVIA